MTFREEGGSVCARCGACLPGCPVYRSTLVERLGPRGKHALLKDGQADFSWDSVRQTVSACLQCGACEAACSAGIAVNREILEARADNREFAPSWPILWRFLSSEMAWPLLYRLLSSIPASSGIIYRLASIAVSMKGGGHGMAFPFPASEPLLSPGGLERFFREASNEAVMASGPSLPPEGRRIALFSGCVQNFIYPEIPGAMAAWFPGTEFVVPAGQCCCGLPALSAGSVHSARRLIERNLRIFDELECDVILTGCASCSYMIRKWPEVVRAENRKTAERVAAVTMECTELAADCIRPDVSCSGRVTFHAPCHSRFSPHGTGASEGFLNRMLGENFVSMEQGCCGHGGSFSLNHPEMSENIFSERIEALGRVGASTLVTTCSGCLLQWRSRADMAGPDGLKVLHVSEIKG